MPPKKTANKRRIKETDRAAKGASCCRDRDTKEQQTAEAATLQE